MKTKLFTLLLAVAASIGTLFAESGTCGENLTWDFTDGVLTISGTGEMEISTWYFLGATIKTVSISYGVTSIGSSAFKNCTGLTSVTIPNSVTSIGDYAFFGCGSLTSVTIPNSVTSIGRNAFYSCQRLTSVTIPNSVKSIGDFAFEFCSSLPSITIPNSVTSIGDWAFSGCRSLTSLTCMATTPPTLGGDVFENVNKSIPLYVPAESIAAYQAADQWKDFTNILPLSGTCGAQGDNLTWELSCEGVLTVSGLGAMTNYSYSISAPWSSFRSDVLSVVISDGVTSIGDDAFYNCSGLTSATIPNSVTSIGGSAFRACSGLTSIEIPNSVTSIEEWAFCGCSGLTSIEIPNSVTSIGNSAFSWCTGLNSLTCEATTPPTLGSNVFNGVDKSIPLYVPAQSVDLYKAADQWKDFTNILPIPGVEPEKFSITWQDEDGNPIKVDEVAYGEIPVFSGATPTKEATAEYTYEFAGWLPKVKEVTEDAKYTTFFERNKIEPTVYTVNINGENCSLHISNELPAGTTLQVEAVADECFEFEKWSDNNTDNPRTITVTEDSNLTAEFNKVTYTITGENENEGGEVQIIP